jgi:hypothetical protein
MPAARSAFMSWTRIRASTSSTICGANGAIACTCAIVCVSLSSRRRFSPMVVLSVSRSTRAGAERAAPSMRPNAASQFASKRFNRAMRAGDTGTSSGGGTATAVAPRAPRPPPRPALPLA